MSEQPPNQKQQQIKLIENHIKDLLFNKADSTEPPPPPTAPDPNYNLKPFSSIGKPFLSNAENVQSKDSLLSSLSLNCGINKQQSSSGSSQLIDLNVLTDFAAKHADINDLSGMPGVLPHPELEDDLPSSSPGTVIAKNNSLLDFFMSQNPPQLPGFSDDSKKCKNNTVKVEQPLNDQQVGFDANKAKRNRKYRKEKPKPNRKVQENVEVVSNQSTSLPVKESPKRERTSSDRHFPSPKESSSKDLKKNKSNSTKVECPSNDEQLETDIKKSKRNRKSKEKLKSDSNIQEKVKVSPNQSTSLPIKESRKEKLKSNGNVQEKVKVSPNQSKLPIKESREEKLKSNGNVQEKVKVSPNQSTSLPIKESRKEKLKSNGNVQEKVKVSPNQSTSLPIKESCKEKLKSNGNVQGKVKVSPNQSTSLPIKESRKREKMGANRHLPSPAGTVKSPEKKREILNHKSSDVNHLARVPDPTGDVEYTMTQNKDGYKFLCNICNYEAKSRDYIHKHVNSENHKEQKKQVQFEKILPCLPKPLPAQVEAIDRLLLNIHAEFGLQEEDLALRKNIAAKLSDFVKLHVTGCSLEMIGSSVSGLGLKSSKVDFTFKVEQEQNIPDSLELLYNKLLSDPAYINVESVFKKKRPGVLFTDKDTGLECSIVLDNTISTKSAKLFSLYSELDPRVKILASCFRYWAKICSLDNQDLGTLPPYTFTLLLVYFLQQIDPPVLPVLHEVKEYGNVDFYEKYMEGKVWKTENNLSVGELWIKLFYFYNFDYEMGKHVVCIRASDKMYCSEKNWSTRFYAFEDPFSRRNIAHVIPNYQVCLYIHQCFMNTYRYFAFPQTKDGEIKLLKKDDFEGLLQSYTFAKTEDYNDSTEDSSASDCDDSSLPDESPSFQDFEDQDPDLPIENVISTIKNMDLDEDEEILDESPDQDNATIPLQNSEKSDSPKKEPKKNKSQSVNLDHRLKVQAACSWDVKDLVLTIDSFNYKMDPVIFKPKKDVPTICKTCKSSGHLTKNCPLDCLPAKVELPPMTEDFSRIITKALKYIKDKNCVEDSDRESLTKIMKEVEAHIQKLFPEANLCMFGSFCNGFGFKSRSDMDFCLTFNGQETMKDLDSTDIIQKLAKHLCDFPRLENIIPVTSAKVPIVKFSCTESGLEGDISLYNKLAIANTEMLELYSRIDSRVQILGFALKYFAKVLGICDASRGSLSSYAYILMVIYYLQQRKPPIIPVLQELHCNEKPSLMIDDWNVWYYKDFDKLPVIWPEYGTNKESLSDLWLGLLSFYAYEFDWKEYVVSIRQKAPLSRFKKLWMTDQIAIEDPFDLNHNLGAGLSPKMNMYILKTFVRGRERFGTSLPLEELQSLLGHEVAYFFDRRFLNSGTDPPHDRGCRKCGKIGHLAKNCPQEKLCMYCRKPGHLFKNCPIRKQKMKPKQNQRNQEPISGFESKNSLQNQNLQGHSLRPHCGGDIQRRLNPNQNFMSKNSDDRDMSRNLMKMGYPSHRHPPPGFPPQKLMGPPGLKPMHQNNVKLARFPSSFPPPFQRPVPMNNISQSSPKHYSGSLPKNYNMYHPEPVPPMGMRSEPRMSPSNPISFRYWQNQNSNRMPQPYTDRRKRTN